MEFKSYIIISESQSKQWYIVRLGLFDNLKSPQSIANTSVANTLKKKIRIVPAVRLIGQFF